MLERERVKLGDLHRGIQDMKHLPAELFFVDGIKENIAINEAFTLGIPVFGMVDSNTDPTSITFPIPSNDDSIKSISSIVGYISNRIIEAKGGNLNENNEQNLRIQNPVNFLKNTQWVISKIIYKKLMVSDGFYYWVGFFHKNNNDLHFLTTCSAIIDTRNSKSGQQVLPKC